MSKTRKHKPSSRKIRKHKPTRKQTGGVCCRYEKATEGQGCDGTPYKRENELTRTSKSPTGNPEEFATRTSKSPTGNPAEFANIGFEPIWFKDGKPVSFEQHASGSGEPFFMIWKKIKFGLTYHSLKHTENLGTTCYDIENLMEVIKKMIPNLNWTSISIPPFAHLLFHHRAGLTTLGNIFNPKDDFETFYNKLAEAPYCVGPSGCLYYSEDQKKADITVCNGYYILKNPTSIKLEIGKRDNEKEEKFESEAVETKMHETIKKATEEKEFEVKLSKKVVDVAAIKLTFIRFLNKNQGGGDLDKFKEVDERIAYEQTLFLYKIEVLDKTNWENQQKILLGVQNIAQVQQVLINNASDCNKDPGPRNNWIKTENGRKRNPRLFLNPWHGINVIKNAQNGPQYRKLIAVAFRDMHEAITNVQTAVNYFSDPYDIFPQDDDDGVYDDDDDYDDTERRYNVKKWKEWWEEIAQAKLAMQLHEEENRQQSGRSSSKQGETKESVVEDDTPVDQQAVKDKLEKMQRTRRYEHSLKDFEEQAWANEDDEFKKKWKSETSAKKKRIQKKEWFNTARFVPGRRGVMTDAWAKFQREYTLSDELQPSFEDALKEVEVDQEKAKLKEEKASKREQAKKNKEAAQMATAQMAKEFKADAAVLWPHRNSAKTIADWYTDRRRLVPATRPLLGINSAICNNPYLKNKKRLEVLEEEIEKGELKKKKALQKGELKKKKSEEEVGRAAQAAALKKKLKTQKAKRPCWYQFLDSLKKFNFSPPQMNWDDWPEEIQDNDAIFKRNNSQSNTYKQKRKQKDPSLQREWTDQNVATRFCTIFLFTGRKLIENFKNLLLEFPNFLSPKIVLEDLDDEGMNGKTGVKGNFNEENGRYEVTLDDTGKTILVKPENISDEDEDDDEKAEEIAENIGKGFAANFNFANPNHQNENFNELMPAYEKFIKDNLKLINIWNTGVRWVIDILDNPCEGWLRRSNDMEWKVTMQVLMMKSFINYWKKVDSLCEGEMEGYPKVTEEIKTIIKKDDGAKSANYLFKKEEDYQRKSRDLEEEEEEKTEKTISQSTEPWSEEEDGAVITGEITLNQRLSKGADTAIVIDGAGKKTRKKKMHRTKRSNRKTKRKKRKTKRRTKRKTKRRRRKRKHKRTRKR